MHTDAPQSPPHLPDARPFIDSLLHRALSLSASDIHLEPTAAGLDVKLRIDGLLQTIEQLPPDLGRGAVLRLMVLAQLLTYRLDIPQEGRVRTAINNQPIDLRLAIMPVAHGLRAVVRLPADLTQPKSLDELALPDRVLAGLKKFARSDSGEGGGGGMLLVTGPAGSGKTTTIYALLSHLAATNPGLSIISLEDPVERLIPGITQIEVTPHGQLTYDRALQSILRQDPQVLMLGEIRNAATASLAIQAALTGHRLIATLHAGDPATAIARLLEMGIEPYQLTSTLFAVLTQRLVRKRTVPAPQDSGLKTQVYKGRVPLAEFATLTPDLRSAILKHADADALRTILKNSPTHQTLRQSAETLVTTGITDTPEIHRVLGDTI
ncbi:MAG TPA: ATPase, T2SS/T4P/T4SS family [Phycisphaerae bacterium]|nr:ATPase, T2SS/T4P/T4SS family [Phycisphaerae bacterium]